MLRRVRDPAELKALVENACPGASGEGSAKGWLVDPRNIALACGDDLGLFDRYNVGVYLGHIYFVSRGLNAMINANAMLTAMAEVYGAERIIGETPVTHTRALIFTRALGFKRLYEAQRPEGAVIVSEYAYGNSQPVRLVA